MPAWRALKLERAETLEYSDLRISVSFFTSASVKLLVHALWAAALPPHEGQLLRPARRRPGRAKELVAQGLVSARPLLRVQAQEAVDQAVRSRRSRWHEARKRHLGMVREFNEVW
mmetsp:Transcript_11691/g.31998  ORF Transcript_11691/g.31998 Transcript_11691/m.31998 type:complete len:115 (+) Transcript_11691:157-501(+)